MFNGGWQNFCNLLDIQYTGDADPLPLGQKWLHIKLLVNINSFSRIAKDGDAEMSRALVAKITVSLTDTQASGMQTF